MTNVGACISTGILPTALFLTLLVMMNLSKLLLEVSTYPLNNNVKQTTKIFTLLGNVHT